MRLRDSTEAPGRVSNYRAARAGIWLVLQQRSVPCKCTSAYEAVRRRCEISLKLSRNTALRTSTGWAILRHGDWPCGECKFVDSIERGCRAVANPPCLAELTGCVTAAVRKRPLQCTRRPRQLLSRYGAGSAMDIAQGRQCLSDVNAV